MTLDGETKKQLDAYRRVVQTQMDALGWPLDEAVAAVPAHLRADLRALIEKEQSLTTERRFYRTGATLRAGGPKAWFEEWDPADGYHWPRLRSYLIDRKGWSPRDVASSS